NSDRKRDPESRSDCDQLVELTSRRKGEVKSGDRRPNHRHRCLGATLTLTQPDAGTTKGEGAEERNQDPCLLVDPAPFDRKGNKERDSEHDGDPSRPSQE